MEQARIGELQPRQVTLKPLPKYLFQPQPTIVATTAVNRAAAQDSAFPDPLAAKRKLGQRPRTTHEHFEVRVQWSMQQSDEKHISAKVATDSTTSASCEDSQPRCCGDVCVACCSSVSVALVCYTRLLKLIRVDGMFGQL